MNDAILIKVQHSETDTFHECLGITEERLKEIEGMVRDVMPKLAGYSDILAEVSKQLTNANELALVAFSLGAFEQANKQ